MISSGGPKVPQSDTGCLSTLTCVFLLIEQNVTLRARALDV